MRQRAGVCINYGVTFAAVIEMTSMTLILVLARKWRVPAKHGDVPNAYVKAEKEAELDIYLRIPQGMVIPKELLEKLGVPQRAGAGAAQGALWPEADRPDLEQVAPQEAHRHRLHPEPGEHVRLRQTPGWRSTGGWSLCRRPAGHWHRADRRGCVLRRDQLAVAQGPSVST
ncbi:unnamed protein product [Phytophthora fragariaefolia]|uniref:Unnamed protein product n=1 Tax=Phytophthora fragariaefolia TaxID=1490495 RepID=A0A9W6YB78_9STRA|nr:unnamed protein product [Phytophthora fragariaefolia]